ncbi:MAG: (2Fe-2S)-binding protein [Pararhodobacter sp.]
MTARDGLMQIEVNGSLMVARAGMTVAAALLENGIYHLRNSPAAGTPRGAFCMMGACQECAILIDGRIRRACQTRVREGMSVVLAGASAA